MQLIAEENNLSETAFFVRTKKTYHIRWFTPNGEVKLCGHATLASAYVIFNFIEETLENIEFSSLSGILNVKRDNSFIVLDFPSQKFMKCQPKRIFLMDWEKIHPFYLKVKIILQSLIEKGILKKLNLTLRL